MKLKSYLLILSLNFCIISSITATANEDDYYSSDFKNASLQSCDNVFHKLEDKCQDMICRDILVNAWAICWKKSMNTELDKRLLQLKKSDPIQFHSEMALQKSFNESTEMLCSKDCGSGGTMKGIPYHFCLIDAYKYRAAQAIQINHHQLSVPEKGAFIPKSSHKKKPKDNKFYHAFAKMLCSMPSSIWAEGIIPPDCQKKVINELNKFEFTDDVCDLS